MDVKDFKYFEIRPVTNATGGPLSRETLSLLTAYLGEQFAAHHLQRLESSQAGNEALLVQAEILEYKFQKYSGPVRIFIVPYSYHDATTGLCLVRTRLLETSTNQIVAEIITLNRLDVGIGMLESKNPDLLLEEIAAAIAKEVAKMR